LEQLGGLDNLFLQAESDRTPMHVTAVLVYNPPTSSAGQFDFDAVYRHFENCLTKSRIFRRKLLNAPFGADKPYWIEDEDFDLGQHVVHDELAAPGTTRDFWKRVSELHGIALDRSRPLWSANVVSGLDNVEDLAPGSFAIVLKVHHAAIDGVSASEIIGAMHSLRPDDTSNDAADDWQPEKAPGKMGLMWRSYLNSFTRPTELMQSVSKLMPAIRKASKKSVGGLALRQKFKTRFNQRVSAERVTNALRIDLDQIRKLRKCVDGATVNDVVVSIVGGGLRRYLAAKDELPEESMVAGAPINTRDSADSASTGNAVSMMRIPLRTDIADPVARLAAVHTGSQSSKRFAKTAGVHSMSDIADSLSPGWLALGIRALTAEKVSDRVPTPLHTVVSNVPGPPVDLFLRGARLRLVLGLGPLIDQVGLFHAVTSVGGSMAITFTSCASMLPDPEFYRQCLLDAFESLCTAAASAAQGDSD